MLKDQIQLLNNQYFIGADGVAYNIYDLVSWAEENYSLQEVPIERLTHEFTEDDGFSEEPDGSPEFIERANLAENFPILIQEDILGCLRVMDGRHRLWKAIVQNRPSIQGYIIPVEELPIEAIHIVEDDETSDSDSY